MHPIVSHGLVLPVFALSHGYSLFMCYYNLIYHVLMIKIINAGTF